MAILHSSFQEVKHRSLSRRFLMLSYGMAEESTELGNFHQPSPSPHARSSSSFFVKHAPPLRHRYYRWTMHPKDPQSKKPIQGRHTRSVSRRWEKWNPCPRGLGRRTPRKLGNYAHVRGVAIRKRDTCGFPRFIKLWNVVAMLTSPIYHLHPRCRNRRTCGTRGHVKITKVISLPVIF